MRGLLAGYFGFVVLNIFSVALNNALWVTQRPRFYGVNSSRNVTMHCMGSREQLAARVQWYKTTEYTEDPGEEIVDGPKFVMNVTNSSASLRISDLQLTDTGIYFCKINNTLGSGTELQVVRPVNRYRAEYRSRMKDGLIVLQGLMLAVGIASILLRKRNLLEKGDSLYEEPETDHIYEGLAIETCGGGLYEELSVYAQAEGTEAPWE